MQEQKLFQRLLLQLPSFSVIILLHTHTHTHTRARARVCVCVCVCKLYFHSYICVHYIFLHFESVGSQYEYSTMVFGDFQGWVATPYTEQACYICNKLTLARLLTDKV